jgi:hypothetical protein
MKFRGPQALNDTLETAPAACAVVIHQTIFFDSFTDPTLTMSLATRVVFRCCRRRHRVSFPRAGCGNLPVRFDEREQETEPSQTGLRWRGESQVD